MTKELGMSIRFLLSKGEYFRKAIMSFPLAADILSAKLLVLAVDDVGEIIGACGIRSMLNVMGGLYVKEDYRGRGLGTQLFEKTLRAGEKRRLGFLTLTVSPDNVASYIVDKFGFEELVFLKKSRQKLMVRPLTPVWKLAYAFLSGICFFLPNTLLFYAHSWLHRRTLTPITPAEKLEAQNWLMLRICMF